MYSLGMPRIARPVILKPEDRQELAQWVNAHTTPQQVSHRCRIILASADGRHDKDIAGELEMNFKTVALWRGRFCKEGADCFWEVAAGRGRKPQHSAQKVSAIIDTSLQRRPEGATHWRSCRSLAKVHGASKAAVNRIWQSHQIKPHRHQEFLKFLKQFDNEFAGKRKLHLVMDNYGTHKHPRVQGWLKRHARFVPHFIPTSSSWLN